MLDIYIFNSWNIDCDPRVSWSFLQNNNHQAVKKMKFIENRKNTKNTDKNLWDFVLYIYLSLLYNCSIQDIEHSSYYIALGSTHTHKVIL